MSDRFYFTILFLILMVWIIGVHFHVTSMSERVLGNSQTIDAQSEVDHEMTQLLKVLVNRQIKQDRESTYRQSF